MIPLRQFILFGIAGTIGFAVDVGVLYLLAPFLGWYVARVLSFLAAASTTWWVNRQLAFAGSPRTSGHATWRQYGRYLILMLAGGLVNYATYVLIISWRTDGWIPLLGVALGSLSGMLVNFASARFLVFGPDRTKA